LSSSQITQNDRKLAYDRSDLSTFFENDNCTIKLETTYKDIERIINVTRKRCDRKNIDVVISSQVKEYLLQNKYSIEQYRILGQVLKSNSIDFQNVNGKEFIDFSQVVQSQVSRKLNPLHLRAAYYEYRMARAANFSVPGAGKTAMCLGVFAYLNRMHTQSEFTDKILVISPINAFESWKSEFKTVFGNKKPLRCLDSQESSDFNNDLNLSWNVANLILVNYESLQKYAPTLKRLINQKTMLVFDEVHRIKNPTGQRASAALSIVNKAKFRFVMTGTPIPNSYLDIYNFLHILYNNEYNSFFGWSPDELLKPNMRQIEKINNELNPFFWRVNKTDLDVPPADPDELLVVQPSHLQSELAKSIYYTEKSSLARLIRLIQASTNPELLNKAISYSQMGFSNEDGNVDFSEKDFTNQLNEVSNSEIRNAKSYKEYDLTSMESPKFQTGIKLVKQLVSENKKVMIWATFVDTMHKIQSHLKNVGITANLVYGGTEVNQRQSLINDFKDGNVQVMISNPQTLGESVSLHKNVHDAVYFEYNFNLTFMLQSRDRIHRLGLKANQHTHYYYLETQKEDATSDAPGYIDQQIYSRLKKKEETMNKAISDKKLTIEYTENEITEAVKIIDAERNRIVKNRNE